MDARREDRWFLIHHHGSPVYSPLATGEQVH